MSMTIAVESHLVGRAPCPPTVYVQLTMVCHGLFISFAINSRTVLTFVTDAPSPIARVVESRLASICTLHTHECFNTNDDAEIILL